MVELRRNKKTGIVESFKDGKKVGEVVTMGDMTKKETPDGKQNRGNSNR